MASIEFSEWMDATGCRYVADIVENNGLSGNLALRIFSDVKDGKDVEIKPPVVLAMSAATAGQDPWKGKTNE
jgi:hypothetical protein